MLAKTYTATILGLQAVKIEVEVDATQGMPRLVIIGLATKAVKESKERITSALRHCQVKIRHRRTIVNLAPTDLKKRSPTFELAIAVALLKMYGEVDHQTEDTLFFGELSLDGALKASPAALALTLAAKKLGFKQVVFPAANSPEVSLVTGLKLHPLHHLQDYLQLQRRGQPLPRLKPTAVPLKSSPADLTSLDDIYGQQTAKRALSIALTGGHHLLMLGPPGAGKSLLAKASLSLAPPLTKSELLAVTSIHSLYGKSTGLKQERPFRQPHHSISTIGLIGGGNQLQPGEITLSHLGILFLDELTEFKQSSLEALRQPLEEKQICLIRARGKVVYPAHFLLIAAANPCPCGFKGSNQFECHCSSQSLSRYYRKLSGPILDRFDLLLKIKPVKMNQLQTKIIPKNLKAAVLKEKVIQARELQTKYLKPTPADISAELSTPEIKKLINLTPAAKKLLTQAGEKLQLTARGYFKTIKLAWTIASLDQRIQVTTDDLTEALQYRPQLQLYDPNSL